MKPTYIIILILFLLAVAISVLRFGLGGDEDSWLCENGQWVAHGHPQQSQPTNPCK